MSSESHIQRPHLQEAFDRHVLRYGRAQAEQKLTAACGVRVVADVPDAKIAAGFRALDINQAVLRVLGVPPIVVNKFPPPVRGRAVKEQLGDIAACCYRKVGGP